MNKIIAKNVRRYPAPGETAAGGGYVVACCLVERVDGVRAYAAIVPDSSVSDPRPDYGWVDWYFVARHGNPVPYEEARSHFPSVGEAGYVR